MLLTYVDFSQRTNIQAVKARKWASVTAVLVLHDDECCHEIEENSNSESCHKIVWNITT